MNASLDAEKLAQENEDLKASQAEQQKYVTRMLQHITDTLCVVAEGDYSVRCTSERDDDFAAACMTINVLIGAMAARAQEMDEKQRLLREREANLVLIDRQREAITELSTPILQLWDRVLALPVIGIVDTARAVQMMEKLLARIQTEQSEYVIIDITGVDVVDTRIADHFVRVIKAAKLLGAECILTGIKPAVAQTLIDLGVDLTQLITLRNLQEGLKLCLKRMNGESRGGHGLAK